VNDGERLEIAKIGVDRTRRGYKVVQNGLMPPGSALPIGLIIDQSPEPRDSFKAFIATSHQNYNQFGSIEGLMCLSEMIAAAIENETARKLFMLGGMTPSMQATRQRQGIVLYGKNKYLTTIPYDSIVSEDQARNLIRETRRAMN
jgi:hypothetical protein